MGGRKNIGRLFNNLYELDDSVNGFVVDELDDIGIGIHHHLIVSSSLSEDIFKRTVQNSWDRKGMNWVENYDSSRDYVGYMCKHIGKTNRNVFDVFNKILIKN